MSYRTRILRTDSQSTAPGRRALHTAVVIAGAMLMASTAANAQGAYGNANYPARDGFGHVRQICETVVRLRPGEAHFDACVSSLVESIQSTRPDHRVMQQVVNAEVPEPYVGTSFDAVHYREQQACARLGFDPAFGAFSNCVANLQANVERLDFPNN
jgi:hypothetical protein